jgi:hypothetical protein
MQLTRKSRSLIRRLVRELNRKRSIFSPGEPVSKRQSPSYTRPENC